MIHYEFGYWGLGFILKRRSDKRAFALAVPPAIFALLLGLLIREERIGVAPHVARVLPFLYGTHDDGSVNYQSYGEFKGLLSLWGSFTFVLSFLLVFRTQIAYGRYWDGISALQEIRGTWFNAASNLIAFTSAEPGKAHSVATFQHVLVRLMSLMHCTALQEVAVMEDSDFATLGDDGISTESLNFLAGSPDRLEVVMQWVQRLIVEAHADGVLEIAPPILSRVFQELSNGIVKVHDALKISDFPFPFPFSQMLTILLCTFSGSMPVVCAIVVYPPIAMVITYGVIFSLWSINYISAEIEQPFGDDPNDLPVRELQDVFNRKLVSLMHPLTQRPPAFRYDPNVHDALIPEEYRLYPIADRRSSNVELYDVEEATRQAAKHRRGSTDTVQGTGSMRDSSAGTRSSQMGKTGSMSRKSSMGKTTSVESRRHRHWKEINNEQWMNRKRHADDIRRNSCEGLRDTLAIFPTDPQGKQKESVVSTIDRSSVGSTTHLYLEPVGESTEDLSFRSEDPAKKGDENREHFDPRINKQQPESAQADDGMTQMTP